MRKTLTDLGEVANQVGAVAVNLGEDVEHERVHVKVERLVIEEQLGQQTQVLAIQLGGWLQGELKMQHEQLSSTTSHPASRTI